MSSSARDECDRLPSVPVTEYSVVKARCCGPHSPATWLIAPDSCVSRTCAASTGSASEAARTLTADTRVTSPATQRAMSRSWIIWSITIPPDSARSPNQGTWVGKAPDRENRNTARSPRRPVVAASCRRAYAGNQRTTWAG